MPYKLHVNPIRPRLLGGDWALEGGGGGWGGGGSGKSPRSITLKLFMVLK